MKASQHLEEIYLILKPVARPAEVKDALQAIVSNAIDHIYEEGLEFSAELLEQKIAQKAKDFKSAAKNRVA